MLSLKIKFKKKNNKKKINKLNLKIMKLFSTDDPQRCL